MDSGESAENSWWDGPSGGREVLAVAAPLVVSSLSWTVLTFVDRVFLKWVSGAAMSAAFGAGVVWFAVVCLPLGICAYASTFVAQYHGDGQPRRIGPSVGQGVWTALLSSPLILLTVPLAPALFALANHEAEVCVYEVEYFQILMAGAPAMLVAQALSCFYSGRGKTGVVMVVDSGSAMLNIVLDYLWIFGLAGFPEMGIAGAGWATVASLWIKAIAYAALVLQPCHREEFATLTGLRLDPALLRRLIAFGGPSGIQMFLDVMGFTVFILLVGRLGVLEAEATSMAFSIGSLAFMPIHGVSMTASILVGQRIGENRDDLAARAAWTSLRIGLTYMAMISVLYVVTPDLFLFSFFAGDASPIADQAPVRELARTLLLFVATYNMLDATMMIFGSAIKGAGDTRYVLRVSLVMASILAALSWLCVEVLHWGIFGCWAIITLWIWGLGLAFLIRFLQGKWRSMRVIEMRKSSPDQVAELVAAE